MAAAGEVAVISAQNEVRTLGAVLQECRRLDLAVTVVANGCTDGSAELAADLGARVLAFPKPLGHDVGRALGAAAHRDAATILFLDGDLVIKAHDLHPFLVAVRHGVDVALNNVDPFCPPRTNLHPVMAGKRFLNLALGRPDLGTNTLTAVPHALSARALARLPLTALAVPPLAQVQAILAGLRVEAVHAVDVIRTNRRRPGLNTGPGQETVEKLILGDHLEALGALLAALGPRGGCTDLGRRRELLAALLEPMADPPGVDGPAGHGPAPPPEPEAGETPLAAVPWRGAGDGARSADACDRAAQSGADQSGAHQGDGLR